MLKCRNAEMPEEGIDQIVEILKNDLGVKEN
jgi:hypothetical protein